MSIVFVVENSGKITRKVTTKHVEKIPVANDQELIINPENANIISGQTHYYDKNTQQFVEYSEQEKQANQFQKLQHAKPVFSGNETDNEINAKINGFYMGQINADAWKKENYAWLRKQFYPSADAFIEAYVVERTTGNTAKMNVFLQAYNDTNARFPA